MPDDRLSSDTVQARCSLRYWHFLILRVAATRLSPPDPTRHRTAEELGISPRNLMDLYRAGYLGLVTSDSGKPARFYLTGDGARALGRADEEA